MIALREKVMYLLFGMLSILAVLFLTGAGAGSQVGRYEMETLVRNNSTQIYVMDTATGAVKWVDAMATPFTELKDE